MLGGMVVFMTNCILLLWYCDRIVSSISCSEVTNFPISRGFVAPFTFLWARFFVLQHGFNVEVPGMSASIAELYFFKIEVSCG